MDFLIVFAAAVLAGLGVGSGGLYLLYLTDIAGVAQYAAQGANLIFFATATLASSLLHLFRGHLPLLALLPLLGVGLAGTAAGSLLTLLIPAAYARRAFGIFMLLGGGYTLYGLLLTRRRRPKRQKRDKKVL